MGIGPSQGCTYKGQHIAEIQQGTCICTSSGLWMHNPSVRAAQGCAHLRQYSH